MEMVPIKPERMAQLEEYAQRHGQDTAEALDSALAEYLTWERRDFQEAVEDIREGYSDLKAGAHAAHRRDVRRTAREAWPSALTALRKQNEIWTQS